MNAIVKRSPPSPGWGFRSHNTFKPCSDFLSGTATSQLEILPLYEEVHASADFISGHGVSYLIRTDRSTILMDAGNNPDESEIAPFMQNMQTLGIDWIEIDRIMLTHPHPDHMGGVSAWQDSTISFGHLPGGLGERLIFVPADMSFHGAVHVTIPTLPSPDVLTAFNNAFPAAYHTLTVGEVVQFPWNGFTF